jgi:hypothetical protein
MEASTVSENLFEIGAPGVDTGRIVAEIRETVARKTREGAYSDPRIARAERANLMNLRHEDEFLPFYLECLKDAVFVDINDFDIHERRQRFSRALVALKRTIWKLLKFYTYRLWSQQNQVNGLLLTAVDSLESRYREKIAALESRVAKLEAAEAPGAPREPR